MQSRKDQNILIDPKDSSLETIRMEAEKGSWTDPLKALKKKSMWVALAMGFSSGLPLLLTLRTLQAWMVDEGVDLSVIGIFALVGVPYTFKFLWSPIMDRYVPKFLGRRRGWLFISQIGLIAATLGIAMISPKTDPWMVAFFAVLIAFFSASQDIVVDAYRRESLLDNELGLGSSLYVYGYRIAMWVSGALALILADHIPWKMVYMVMAAGMLIGVLVTLWAEEPKTGVAPPKTLRESVVDPLLDFMGRNGAWMMLIFILLYKVGDTMAGSMATPFYLMTGFTKTEIGVVAKTFGFFSSLGGALIGGFFVLRYGIHKSLWVFGILQALSTLCFAGLATVGAQIWALTVVVIFEDASGGMGTAAFAAYMASLTNKKFTATQYALLTSVMGIPRVLISAPTGYLAEAMGWIGFFVLCALIAIPGLLLLTRMPKYEQQARQ